MSRAITTIRVEKQARNELLEISVRESKKLGIDSTSNTARESVTDNGRSKRYSQEENNHILILCLKRTKYQDRYHYHSKKKRRKSYPPNIPF